jgi:hypothetical protein
MDTVIAPVDQTTSSGKALPVVNLISFILVVIINAISSAGVISKYGVGQVSGMYQTLITPASYAFSIWGIIYFAVAVFIVWQCIPALRDDYLVFHQIGWWFAVSCVFNAVWIMCFVQGSVGWVWISTFLLFAIFGSLLMLITRVGVWTRAFQPAQSPTSDAFSEFSDSTTNSTKPASKWNTILAYFAVDFAFSVYCAWTTVASIVNLSLSLVGSGFDGDKHADVWAIAILVVAAIIFLLVVGLKSNWAFGFVFTWAAMAISKKAAEANCTNVPGFNNTAGCVRVQKTAEVLAIILGTVSAVQMVVFLYQASKLKRPVSESQPVVVSGTIQHT